MRRGWLISSGIAVDDKPVGREENFILNRFERQLFVF